MCTFFCVQVRGKALAEGVPKDQLSSRQLASALLELAEEDESPFVVFLKDKGSAVLKSRGMCQRSEGEGEGEREERQTGCARVERARYWCREVGVRVVLPSKEEETEWREGDQETREVSRRKGWRFCFFFAPTQVQFSRASRQRSRSPVSSFVNSPPFCGRSKSNQPISQELPLHTSGYRSL